MGLHRFKPPPSGRMGTLWTLSSIRDAAIVEFGCMGHMMYSGVTLENTGIRHAAKRYSTHIDETDIALGGTEILRMIDGAFGMKPRCVLTSDTSVAQIEHMGAAHINLVIRREGERAAKYLQNRFGTPYLLARPYGIQGTIHWIDKIAETLGVSTSSTFVTTERTEWETLHRDLLPLLRHMAQDHPEEIRLSISAHTDMVRGVLSFGCDELRLPKGVCWCDSPDRASEDIPYLTEDEWTPVVQAHRKGLLMASGED